MVSHAETASNKGAHNRSWSQITQLFNATKNNGCAPMTPLCVLGEALWPATTAPWNGVYNNVTPASPVCDELATKGEVSSDQDRRRAVCRPNCRHTYLALAACVQQNRPIFHKGMCNVTTGCNQLHAVCPNSSKIITIAMNAGQQPRNTTYGMVSHILPCVHTTSTKSAHATQHDWHCMSNS